MARQLIGVFKVPRKTEDLEAFGRKIADMMIAHEKKLGLKRPAKSGATKDKQK